MFNSQIPMELQPEAQAISRQQKMAELLMAKGMQATPGQTVAGGVYVPTNPMEHIANLFNAYAGSKGLENVEQQQLQMAKAIREGKDAETSAIMEDVNAGRNKEALAKIQSSKFGAGKDLAGALVGNVIPKATEPKVVGNYLIGPDGKVMFKAPKEYAPHPLQLVPTQTGFAMFDPNTRSFTSVPGQGGTGGSAPMPPLPQHLQTEVASINQQKSTINDVLKAVENSRQYFGTKYAVPSLLGGELGAAKMNQKLPSEAVEARSQVFNTASSVIKERAGTAQSKQEKETIMRFLPSEFDNDKVVIDKLNGFNKYLESKEKGLTPVIGAIPTYRPNATQTPSNANKSAIPAGVTPEQWNVMTPDEKAAFK